MTEPAAARDFAEAESRRRSRAAIRDDGERIVMYLEQHPQAQAEIETYGTPIGNCGSKPLR
jgi:hypothetical protein